MRDYAWTAWYACRFLSAAFQKRTESFFITATVVWTTIFTSSSLLITEILTAEVITV